MADNAAAERVVHRIEKAKQKGEAMEKTAKEGLKLLLSDIKRQAALAREIMGARGNTDQGSYQEWLQKFNERQGEMGAEFTGFEADKPWERE